MTFISRGYVSASTDPIAHTWDELNNCLFTTIHTFDAQIIKSNDNFYMVKDPKLNSALSDFELQNFMFQIYSKPQSLCSHPKKLNHRDQAFLIINITQLVPCNTAYKNRIKLRYTLKPQLLVDTRTTTRI